MKNASTTTPASTAVAPRELTAAELDAASGAGALLIPVFLDRKGR